MISVILYAIGSGLIEVLISPIVEACPFENKEGVMSTLHSFYCWGAMAVILGFTLFFTLFGMTYWPLLAFIWVLLPLYNTFNFINCPIKRLVEENQQLSFRQLIGQCLFWLMIVLMICAGACEASMAQWSSAFCESALHASKPIGDLLGPCMFAFWMGISRMLYVKYSKKLNLITAMLSCGLLCTFCYLLASLAPVPILGLIGCSLFGLAVGLMWPGSISISSKHCPNGGAAMFALLALSGDLGAMVSPTLVGNIAQVMGGNLTMGLLFATLFPILLLFVLVKLKQ